MNEKTITNEDKNYNQVCVWPGVIIGKEKIKEFEDFMQKEFSVRAKYIEEIITLPDMDDSGHPIENTGGRNDVLFSIPADDLKKFIIARLSYGIRWIEDVLNNNSKIYPARIKKYRSW